MLNTKEVINELKNLININKIYAVTISNPLKKSEGMAVKVKVKPVIVKGRLMYQLSSFVGDKVYHKNVMPEEIIDRIIAVEENNFKQCEIKADVSCTVLMNKKRQFTVTGIKENKDNAVNTQHNNVKKYILAEGEYVDWMYRLGLMDKEGHIHSHKQKKFRQINKFLEMLRDIENEIPENSTVIDMGCGKSYLTFAMYHYFNEVKNKKGLRP